MEINIRKLLKTTLIPNDIIINDLNTYPERLIKLIMCEGFCEKDIKHYFYENINFNVIGVHFTRLFDYEIEDIKINGLHSDETADYKIKINRMPKEFDSYKSDLLKQVSNPNNKRSDGKIYFDVGKIEITEDNIEFLKLWGGETLYSIFDNPNFKRQDIEQFKIMLAQSTSPYIVILYMPAYQFFYEYPDNKSIISGIKSNTINNYEGEHCTDKSNIKVIDVIPIKGIS